MYLPIFVVVVYSFNDTKLFHWAGFTFSWYQKLFHNQTIINAFFNSLKLAVLSSGLAAILGTMGAVGMAGRTFFGKGALEGLSTVPIMIPEIILGMAYLAFFTLLQVPFGMLTLVAGPHHLLCALHLYQCQGQPGRARPRLGEAALDLGASRRRVFFDITAPTDRPGHRVWLPSGFCHEHGRRGHQLLCHRPGDRHPALAGLFHAENGGHSGDQRPVHRNAGNGVPPGGRG